MVVLKVGYEKKSKNQKFTCQILNVEAGEKLLMLKTAEIVWSDKIYWCFCPHTCWYISRKEVGKKKKITMMVINSEEFA